MKINKMPEFYMILARKNITIRELFAEKLTKIPNFTSFFLPEKCPNFT